MKRYQTRYQSYPAYTIDELTRDFRSIITPPRASHWVFILDGETPVALLMDYRSSVNSYEAMVQHAKDHPLFGLLNPRGVAFGMNEAQKDVRSVIQTVRNQGLAYIPEKNIAFVEFRLANNLYRAATGYEI